MKFPQPSAFSWVVLATLGCVRLHLSAATFGEDAAFLQSHTGIIQLSDASGSAKVLLSPAWQGRVLTSTAGGDAGPSFGWINRELIDSGKLVPHFNAFGGEDRFWLGPEGGQFSIFFAHGVAFNLTNWFTPAPVDSLPFTVAGRSRTAASFTAQFSVTNYSGTCFEVGVKRTVRLLEPAAVWTLLKVAPAPGLNLVAYETDNTIRNQGTQPWTRQTGALSIWLLGQFNPSPATTIVVPIKNGPESSLGVRVTSNYFGPIPPARLVVRDDHLFFKGDGLFRSKIGINPVRSQAILGSYDADHQVLTLVQYDQDPAATDYVNSLWQLQDHPFSGDAVNSYNDGPPAPGAKPLGPFYEMESSSPAAFLAPGQSLSHVRRTMHLTGPVAALNTVALATLGVSLADIQSALPKP